MMSSLSLRRHACAMVAVLAGAFALAVLAAWYLRATGILQWRADQAPAQFNAALGLLACAAGLLAASRDGRRLPLALGLFAAVLGALSLAQYLLPLSLGIDALLFEPYITVQTSTPGRMAPNAALCLVLAGIALACIGARRAALVAGMAALAGAVLALVAADGYLIGVEMAYGWSGATQLDFPTALALAAIHLCLVWQAAPLWQAGRALRWLWLPALVCAAMVGVTAIIWLSLLDAERQQLREATHDESERLIGQVGGAIAIDLRTLEQMRGRWQLRGGIPHTEWQHDAAAIERDSALLGAVLLVDATRRVRWAAPGALAARVVGADLGAELDSLAALEHARVRRATTFTHVFKLPHGGDGMLAVLPLADGAYLVGVFDAASLAAPFAASPYAVQLYDGEQKLHSHADGLLPAPDLIRERGFALANIGWRLRLWPTARQVAQASSWQPAAVLAAGLCMALLLASITLLVQLSGARARKLQREMAERLKVEQENALLISELEVVFANVVVGIALVKDGRTVRCNEQYARLLGSALAEVAGQPVQPHHPGVRIACEHGLAAGSCSVELELARADGGTFWAACFGKALDGADPSKGMVWVVEEISARKMAEEQLLFQAQHDALTGLANRAMFAQRLDSAIANAARQGRSMAVCYIDLDKFKHVNDTYGHDAGDHLLLTMAHRLTGAVRDSDTVARLGGDEFALVLAGAVDRQVVAAVLDRILRHLQEELSFGPNRFAVSGSIGMAMYPEDGEDAQTLLKHADEAMYAAKQAGRNNWRAYHDVSLHVPAPVSVPGGAPADGRAGAAGLDLAAEEPDGHQEHCDRQQREVEG